MPIKLIPPRKDRSPNYTIRGTYLGVYVNESTGTRRKEVAERYRKRKIKDIESGLVVVRSEKTFADAALKYLQTCPDSEAARVRRALLRLGEDSVDMIDDDALQEWAAEDYPPGVSSTPSPRNATINREIVTPVSAALKSIKIDRKFARYPEPAGRIRLDDPKKILKFINALPEQVVSEYGRAAGNVRYPRACAVTIFATGRRRIDMFGLDWERDIDLAQRVAKLGKTKNGEPRIVHLNEAAFFALANLPHRKGSVFGYLGIDTINRDWRDAREAVGLDGLTPHGARHNFASWLRQSGADLKLIMEAGEWKDVKSVLRYEHIPTEEIVEALENSPLNLNAAGKK